MDSENTTITPLKKVLAYNNPDVIYSFMDEFNISYKEADSIFNETKKWLWACYYRTKDPKYADINMSVDDSILIIDKMWHTFILFTNQYYDFCHKYFSRFIGHKPTSYTDKQVLKDALKEGGTEMLNKEKEARARQLSYLYDVLGETTIRKWYLEYKSKYTPETILAMRKK